MVRLREARLLLNSECCDGAYYLAGDAIECALKACIAKGTQRHDFPDNKLAAKSHVHEPVKLVEAAKLTDSLDCEILANSQFKANWNLVKDWTSESRYRTWSRTEASDFLAAISRKRDGVLVWFKRRW